MVIFYWTGTETRVNAANEANEYMVAFKEGSEMVRPPHFK
jgi:hypothetical protein